jgi:hypothetical protein
MTTHTLPILLPGNLGQDRTVDVPCKLPESFDFRVFLPSRGVRTFTAWLTSTNPLKAEVKDVQLANREGDPRSSLSYEVDDDEQKRADEAAGDVLEGLCKRLGADARGEFPGVHVPILGAIANTWEAEELAVSRATAVYALFLADKATSAAEDINKRIPDLTAPSGQERSPACEAMRCYVDRALEQAMLAQSEKADRQQAEHSQPDDTEPSGSERARGERSLDKATLLCLDVSY